MFAEEKKDVEMVEKKIDDSDNSVVPTDCIPDVDPTTVTSAAPAISPEPASAQQSSVKPVASVAVASDSYVCNTTNGSGSCADGDDSGDYCESVSVVCLLDT